MAAVDQAVTVLAPVVGVAAACRAVGWMVAHRESAALAERLLADTIAHQRIGDGQLSVHADRGSSMTSKPAEAITAAHAGVLEAAYAARPERFVRKPPEPPRVPEQAWINKPNDPTELPQQFSG